MKVHIPKPRFRVIAPKMIFNIKIPICIRKFIQSIIDFFWNSWYYRFEEKAKVRVDSWDIWDMSVTLGKIILPTLKKYREDIFSAPIIDEEDIPNHIKEKKDTFEYEGEYYIEAWKYILDEIIWAFEQITDANAENQFHTGELKYEFVPIDDKGNEVPKEKATFFRFDEKENSTFKFDKEAYELWNEKINKNMILFGKYFRALWS